MILEYFITKCSGCNQVTKHAIIYQVGLRVLTAFCYICDHMYLDDTENIKQ